MWSLKAYLQVECWFEALYLPRELVGWFSASLAPRAASAQCQARSESVKNAFHPLQGLDLKPCWYQLWQCCGRKLLSTSELAIQRGGAARRHRAPQIPAPDGARAGGASILPPNRARLAGRAPLSAACFSWGLSVTPEPWCFASCSPSQNCWGKRCNSSAIRPQPPRGTRCPCTSKEKSSDLCRVGVFVLCERFKERFLKIPPVLFSVIRLFVEDHTTEGR